MIEYKLTRNNLHIVDGFRTRKWNMSKELRAIKEKTPSGFTIVFQRSMFSLKMEWIAHNFLYNVGYKREQVGNVDLDNPCDRPEWLYIVCGLLTWIFVW